MMRVLVRVDAGYRIGSGHVMRCLTLCQHIKAYGAEVLFLMRDHDGHMGDLVAQAGFGVAMLPKPPMGQAVHGHLAHSHWLGLTQEQDFAESLPIIAGFKPDLVIVDHYALDACWHQLCRPYTDMIFGLDDLGDRAMDVDVLLNQNLGVTPGLYQGLVPPGAHLLCGTNYALLRPEFAACRLASLARRHLKPIKRIIISLGGTDPDNVTGLVLNALNRTKRRDFCVDVVLGLAAAHGNEIRQMAPKMGFSCQLHQGVGDMAALLSRADLAIGAVGGSAWERCCLGLPTWATILADNQRAAAHELVKYRAATIVYDQRRPVRLGDFDDFAALYHMGQQAALLCDGMGTNRVWATLQGFLN